MESSKDMSSRMVAEDREILAAGEVQLHRWQNCAPGTYGGRVHDLLRRGLMSADWQDNPSLIHTKEWSLYSVTAAGRAALTPPEPSAQPLEAQPVER
jgi:hypothetical protein